MEKTTKLNSSIRSLYRARAKQLLERNQLKTRQDVIAAKEKVVNEITKHPDVKPYWNKLQRAYRSRQKADQVVGSVIKELAKKTGVSVYCNTVDGFELNVLDSLKALQDKFQSIRRDNAKVTNDHPVILEFYANLSLLKTVGEADVLLSKLG